MRQVWQLLRSLHNVVGSRKAQSRRPQRKVVPWRPHLEGLEERMVPSTVSSITSNFNGNAIPAGDTIWFSSVGKISGVGSSPVNVYLTNQTITFSVSGTPVTVNVPDATITIVPGATSASTSFDTTTNTWVTTEPSHLSGNTVLAGVIYPVSSSLPGGINPVTWQASFSTDTPGVKLNWQWAAAVYTKFSTDNTQLGVKPVDANNLSTYQNSDQAGTPENFRTYVTGGARGGGGSNFTGSYSGTASVTPDIAPLVATGGATLSGTVFNDLFPDGIQESNEPGIGGVVMTLTGTDLNGNHVVLTATTDQYGHFTFRNVPAGSYMLQQSAVSNLLYGQDTPGTVNGSPDGAAFGNGLIGRITLNDGDNAVGYDFANIGGAG
jgi:hypothetical protein